MLSISTRQSSPHMTLFGMPSSRLSSAFATACCAHSLARIHQTSIWAVDDIVVAKNEDFETCALCIGSGTEFSSNRGLKVRWKDHVNVKDVPSRFKES